ncbi:MAG: hypothetical protein MK165_01055, partial [Pirellulaceae bacterium]|nr:hypothetical protein [Pirellulaceae bacterium]
VVLKLLLVEGRRSVTDEARVLDAMSQGEILANVTCIGILLVRQCTEHGSLVESKRKAIKWTIKRLIMLVGVHAFVA